MGIFGVVYLLLSIVALAFMNILAFAGSPVKSLLSIQNELQKNLNESQERTTSTGNAKPKKKSEVVQDSGVKACSKNRKGSKKRSSHHTGGTKSKKKSEVVQDSDVKESSIRPLQQFSVDEWSQLCDGEGWG